MSCFASRLPGVVALVLAQPPGPTAGDEQPRLTFIQDGKDLVVSSTIEIQDVPHVLWTRAEVVMSHDPYLLGPRHPPRPSRVELSYEVIRCRDDPAWNQAGKTRKVEVAWRLVGHRKSDVPYRVVKQFNPPAAELKELVPKLAKIAEETQRRQRSPEFAP